MKVKSLALLAGAGGGLFFAGTANATFTGLSWTINSTAEGEVHRVFANFDNTTDHMLAVAGTAASPMVISTTGAFYQSSFGNDRAPNPALFGALPSVANDTYVTIGAVVSTDFGGDQTGLAPEWPGFSFNFLGGTNLAWFVTPDAIQGSAANGPVMIGQFTVVPGFEADSAGFFFSAFLLYVSDGVPAQAFQPSIFIPAPGALALLGMASVVGRPRRRRS